MGYVTLLGRWGRF